MFDKSLYDYYGSFTNERIKLMFANDISRKSRCGITTTRKAFYNRDSGSLSTTYFINKELK